MLTFNKMENQIEMGYKFINPAMSLFIQEEYKFYSISAKLIEKILNINVRFDDIEPRLIQKKNTPTMQSVGVFF